MERDDTFNRVTLNNHDGDVYVETTGEYSEIVLKTQKVRVDGDVYCFDGDEGISARIDGVDTRLDALNSTNDGLKTRLDTLETATLPPKCIPPGGKYLQFNGTSWLCVCERASRL